MTLALLIALVVMSVAFPVALFVLLDRRDARDRVERASWLQRIQNPQAAVAEHHAALTPPEPAPNPFPMSDEEMAEMEAQRVPDSIQALIARMEAAENGTVQIEDGLLP